MPNMSLKKNEMPSQAPEVRNKNFQEVALGYTAETAMDEAQRCLNCRHKPCVTGCPVQIDIPAFIAEVAKGDFDADHQPLQLPSRGVRKGVPPGDAVRAEMRARHQGRTRRHRPAGALCGGLS